MLLRERGKMPLDLDLFQDKAEASIWTVKRISALQIMILGHMISMNSENHILIINTIV